MTTVILVGTYLLLKASSSLPAVDVALAMYHGHDV